MFELTNKQRKCFALLPTDSNWTRIELKPSPYDQFRTLEQADQIYQPALQHLIRT